MAKVGGEQAKVSVRHARKLAMDAAKKLASEDERKRVEKEVQRITDDYIAQVRLRAGAGSSGWHGVFAVCACEAALCTAPLGAGTSRVGVSCRSDAAACGCPLLCRLTAWWPRRRRASRCTTAKAARNDSQ